MLGLVRWCCARFVVCGKRRMRLERRRPRLHECEARKALSDLRPERFDAAEATALQAGTPAFQSHPPFAADHEQRTTKHTKQDEKEGGAI